MGGIIRPENGGSYEETLEDLEEFLQYRKECKGIVVYSCCCWKRLVPRGSQEFNKLLNRRLLTFFDSLKLKGPCDIIIDAMNDVFQVSFICVCVYVLFCFLRKILEY